MLSHFRRGVTLPNKTFFGLLFAGGVGWFCSIFLLGKIHESGLSKLASDLGVEAMKAILIGTVAAIAIDRYLEHAVGETAESTLRDAGIKHIYSTRTMAANDLLSLLKTTKRLHMVGISLRDFLPHTGALHPIWTAVCDRLLQEHRDAIPIEERLFVRILLLDPRSSEGIFRHSLEKKEIGVFGLPNDVPSALTAVSTQQDKLDGSSKDCLQARLYEHCPFAFIISTDKEIFVEQYDYRSQARPAALPILTYQSDSPQYNELQYSLKRMWENAYPSELHRRNHVGTAEAIRECELINIFRKDDRSLLSDRESEAVLTSEHAPIDIMAISGKFYRDSDCIRRVAEPPHGKQVRLAIVNPVSQQAILRAVADQRTPDRVGAELQHWTWSKHTETQLYSDVHHTMNYIRNWKEKGFPLELRLYSSAVSCALLLTAEVAFIEQYVYGRSEAAARAEVLGGEYPVFEYCLGKQTGGVTTIETQVLSATFNMVWDCFSVTEEQYLERKEIDEFEENLERLRKELRF